MPKQLENTLATSAATAEILPRHRSLACIVSKIRGVVGLYISPTVWSGLSSQKHYHAGLFWEFLQPFASMHAAAIDDIKLASAAFKLRQEINSLKSKYKQRAMTTLQASPVTLPMRGESRVALTATPEQKQLDHAVANGRIDVAVICLIMLGVSNQLHQCKAARLKHPGIISTLTFSKIHGVGQYDGILSAINRMCNGLLKICDATEQISFDVDENDNNYICVKLIELLTDILCEITFDRELLRFGQKYHSINPVYYLKSGILASGYADRETQELVNTFWNWLYLIATSTYTLDALNEKHNDLKDAISALETTFARLRDIDPQYLQRFNEIKIKIAAVTCAPIPSSKWQRPALMLEFEERVPDVVAAVVKADAGDVEAESETESEAVSRDQEWGAITPVSDPEIAAAYFATDDKVAVTPVATPRSRDSDLERSALPAGLLRSPRAAEKVVPG